MRIRSKILLSNIIFIILIFLISGIAIQAILASEKNLDTFYADRFVPVRDLNEMYRHYALMRQNAAEILVSMKKGNLAEANRFYAENVEANREAGDLWKAYLATYLLEDEKKLRQEYDQAFVPFIKDRDEFMAGYKAGASYEVLDDHLQDWEASYAGVEKAVENLIDFQAKVGEALKKETDETVRTTLTIAVIVLIISMLTALTVILIMNATVIKPLGNAVERVKDIAEGEGDLTKRLSADSTDEIGDLATWLNRFIEKIHQIVNNIAKGTEQILNASGSLNTSSQSLSSGTEQMSTQSQTISSAATQMDQNFQVVSSSVEEMSITIGEVAKKSANASGISTKANQTANDTNMMMKKLGNDATEIGKVIEAIGSIAEQTNLLALNASIEAAGAGEAGRGFAVVAAEVKELARQAAESSEDIKHKILAIQKSSEQSVDAMDEITRIISNLDEINSGIAAAVEEQSVTAKEIASNIAQSAKASSDITKNIAGISQASREGAKEASNVNGFAGSLQNLSEELKTIVNLFKF
jgi:methyl-accepting chemotaxis protein